jgi:hypothetical protein
VYDSRDEMEPIFEVDDEALVSAGARRRQSTSAAAVPRRYVRLGPGWVLPGHGRALASSMRRQRSEASTRYSNAICMSSATRCRTSTGGTDPWTTPQPIRVAIRELTLFDGFASFNAEEGFVWHRLIPRGFFRAGAKPDATSKDAGRVNQRNPWGDRVSVAVTDSETYWTLVLPGRRSPPRRSRRGTRGPGGHAMKMNRIGMRIGVAALVLGVSLLVIPIPPKKRTALIGSHNLPRGCAPEQIEPACQPSSGRKGLPGYRESAGWRKSSRRRQGCRPRHPHGEAVDTRDSACPMPR